MFSPLVSKAKGVFLSSINEAFSRFSLEKEMLVQMYKNTLTLILT